LVWAIGDIQGCYDSFIKLLDKINFNPNRDTLFIAGDLVNRGAKSKEVLKYLYNIRGSLRVVLGNHDIALLAIYFGLKKSNPTLEPILKDPKHRLYLEWLRGLDFVIEDKELGFVMAHAGIPPQFNLKTAMKFNTILKKRLKSKRAKEWLKIMMEQDETKFSKDMSKIEKERFALGSFIRMRYIKAKDCKLDFKQKGAPRSEIYKKGLVPWFECPKRKAIKQKIIFGHWSTLGYYENREVCCLDSGCLWRGKLTAKRLDSKKQIIKQVDCKEGIDPF